MVNIPDSLLQQVFCRALLGFDGRSGRSHTGSDLWSHEAGSRRSLQFTTSSKPPNPTWWSPVAASGASPGSSLVSHICICTGRSKLFVSVNRLIDPQTHGHQNRSVSVDVLIRPDMDSRKQSSSCVFVSSSWRTWLSLPPIRRTAGWWALFCRGATGATEARISPPSACLCLRATLKERRSVCRTWTLTLTFNIRSTHDFCRFSSDLLHDKPGEGDLWGKEGKTSPEIRI